MSSRDWEKVARLLPGFDPWVDAGDAFHFDAERADRACDFFPLFLRHAKSRHAGKRFVLEPWQEAFIGNLFGWVDDAGLRRFSTAFLYTAKKQGKSSIAAGLVLYAMLFDDEPGCEAYSCAASQQQSAIIFDIAAGMVQRDRTLRTMVRIYGGGSAGTRKALEWRERDTGIVRGMYRPLTADVSTCDGLNVHFLVVDELHRHKKRELVTVLVNSTSERRQPIVLYATTADWVRPSLCNELHRVAANVRDGKTSRRSFLPALYELERDADIHDETLWPRANPNLDVTVPSEFIRARLQSAEETPSEMALFKRLHLNIQTDAAETWLDSAAWRSCTGEALCTTVEERAAYIESLRDRPCHVGVDLATTQDICAVSLYFPGINAGPASCLAYCFVPELTARSREARDSVPYAAFRDAGALRYTDGGMVDFGLVKSTIVGLGELFDVRSVSSDPWHAYSLLQDLRDVHGFTNVREIRPGFRDMNAPTKELERLVSTLGRDFQHGGDPCLEWQALNVTIQRDGEGNIRPSKERSGEKIDAIAALVFAIAGSMSAATVDAGAYEDRGFVVI